MLHLHGKLGVAPFNIAGTLERSARRSETLKLSQKLSAFITTKGDECRSCVTQACTIGVGKQSPQRSRLAVSIRTDHHKVGFHEALGLEPSLAATRPIGCQGMFGDDALKRALSAGLEQGGTITIELIAKLNAAIGVSFD
jgi:hypothetical protein